MSPGPLAIIAGIAGLVTILAAAYGFYTGILPQWIRRIIGFHELKADVERVRENTEDLQADHAETMAEIDTLKDGQIALARAVDDEHDSVNVEALHDEHYGEVDRPDDFLRGGGHVPDGGQVDE